MGRLSQSAAIIVIKAALQLIVALIPALIITRMARKKSDVRSLSDAHASTITILFALVLWVSMIILMLIAVFGYETVVTDAEELGNWALNTIASSSIPLNMLNSAMIALGGGLVAALFAYGFLSMNRTNRVGFFFSMLVLLPISSSLMGEYILLRRTGLLNTLAASALHSLTHPDFILLLIVVTILLRMKSEHSSAKGVILFFLFAFAALSWGDYFAPMLYTPGTANQPIALAAYKLLMGSAELPPTVRLETIQLNQMLTILMVAIPGILFSLLAAFNCIRCFRRAD